MYMKASALSQAPSSAPNPHQSAAAGGHGGLQFANDEVSQAIANIAARQPNSLNMPIGPLPGQQPQYGSAQQQWRQSQGQQPHKNEQNNENLNQLQGPPQAQLHQPAQQPPKWTPQQQMVNESDTSDDLDNDVIGVIKIKDGLFICDELGAQDLEFVVANKVTRVINTAGTQLRNFWEAIGVLYLTLNWQDDEKQTLFDAGEKIPEEIYKFMEEAVENHESVLVQSVRGQNRACFVIAAFLMRRYSWTLLKTLEFLNSRRPDLELRASFLCQLQQYENRLYAKGIGPKTQRWTELSDTQTYHLENEELILRNTYLNSQSGPIVDFSQPLPYSPEFKKSLNLKWRDISTNQHKDLTEENRDEDDLVNLIKPPKIMNHYTKQPSMLKSKLKGTQLHSVQKSQAQAQTQAVQDRKNQLVREREQRPKTQQVSSSSEMENTRHQIANTKSKFLTKTTMQQSNENVHPGGGASKENMPSHAPAPSAGQQPSTTSTKMPTAHIPLHSFKQQQQQQQQPASTKQNQSNQPSGPLSFYYRNQTQQQQEQKQQLTQKQHSQQQIGTNGSRQVSTYAQNRPQSHQIRDHSPLASQQVASQAQNNTKNQKNQNSQNQPPTLGGGYQPFEPKKRELTQKVAPKMPVSMPNQIPMTQDLTNLSNSNGNLNNSTASATANSSNSRSHHDSRPKSSQVPSSHGTLSLQKAVSKTSTGRSSLQTRGISPSFQSKTSDLSIKNRGTLSSQMKKVAGNEPTHQRLAYQPANQRPGSAPKMRQNNNGIDSSGNSSTSGLGVRGQHSSGANTSGLGSNTVGNGNSGLSKALENGQASSKNMLNSFRNGPIKIMGSSSMGGTVSVNKQKINSQKLHQGHQNAQAQGGRPSSAPAKRPPSPGNSASNTYSHQPVSSTGQQRVKFNKNSQSTSKQTHSTGGGVANQHQSSGQGAPGLKNGMNPTLRGYSPSKPRWKIGGNPVNNGQTTNGSAASAAASRAAVGQHQNTHMYGSGSNSTFGSGNPNVYTRSTKHTPSYK